MNFQVTRSLLVASEGDRLAAERAILLQHFPQFTIVGNGKHGRFAVATGTLRTFAGKSYGIKVVAESSYPHVLPDVEPSGWVPTSNPHMIGKSLCVMRSNQWQSYMSLAFLVAKSALWLNKYEVFLIRRIWPGPEQHRHGTVYNVRKWWHDL
ncbi:hypothetical protein [Amycolatopsis solani]|uniref:hypothetical protein n=1 Tax=Amycolatopsis solani TaxID=3028615 RepID=UPI0025B1F27D|nr:hypothetical protein [Amycolatopsis sp. MEP2-6]